MRLIKGSYGRLNAMANQETASLQGQINSLEAMLGALLRTQYGVLDFVRRMQGDALSALGLGPNECPYRVIASGQHWRLRDYSDSPAAQGLLIVAAPIKRPYIWDLTPSVSPLRYCLTQRFGVYLLEWLPASLGMKNNGLDEHASAISECVATVSNSIRGAKPFMIGHSLGGTLAAIASALAPDSIQALVLLGTPLCFEPGKSRFRDTLVSLVPPTLSAGPPVPGSLLSQVSVLASPATFIWSRLADAALSATDRYALDIHARVERWALDEAPLPGKLVHEMVEWLYRENRLCRGTLEVCNVRVGPFRLSVPTLAVVNTADEVAPLASVKPFIEAMPTSDVRIVQFPGETGVGLQHLGILVGRQAHAQLWPEIIVWLNSHI